MEAEMEVVPPPKIHITEERMVSQLSGIHLSKEYTPHGGIIESALPEGATEIEETIRSKLDAQGAIPSLSVCDEIRALQNRVESILPDSILEK